MNPQQAKLRKRERAVLLALLLLLLKFKDGQISKSEFLADAVQLLADAYTDAVVIGSGREAEPQQSIDPINTALEQRSYLAGLADDVSANRYSAKSDGGQGAKALRARVTLYILLMTGLANKAWVESKQKQAEEQGEPEPEGLWQLGSAEHCEGCIDESEKGWRPLSEFDTFPGEGDTPCLSRCKCSVVLRDGSTGFSNP